MKVYARYIAFKQRKSSICSLRRGTKATPQPPPRLRQWPHLRLRQARLLGRGISNIGRRNSGVGGIWKNYFRNDKSYLFVEMEVFYSFRK
jgi:hypothetical protein